MAGGRRLHRALLAACLSWAAAGCAQPPPPNVLLVVIDTLRADHSSAYGYARDTTPRLAALAAEGVLFEQAYAPMGLTGPSHATLFTGLHPLTHGVVRNGLALGAEHVTVAEYLAVRGYQTAAVVSSFVLDRRFGLAQGFAHYDDELSPEQGTVEIERWEGHELEAGFDRRADHTALRAERWLREERRPDAPFFLFVHFFDPHTPYQPPPSHAGRFAPASDDVLARLTADYDAEIAFTDAALGRLLDALDELGLARNTIVAVTADHGEGLMQRGYLLHGLSVHEEEVRVPLVLRWPAGVPGGRRVAAPVALLDLMPTLAQLTGVAPGGTFSEGVRLAELLRGEASGDALRAVHLYRRDFGPGLRSPILTAHDRELPPETVEVAGEQFALRRGRYKYVAAPDEGGARLYDLEADPEERRDRAAEEPDVAAELRGQLEGWLDAHGARVRADAPSDADRERLRALGYAE